MKKIVLVILSVMAFCAPSSLFAQKMMPDTTVCFVQRDSSCFPGINHAVSDTAVAEEEPRWSILPGGQGIIWDATKGLPYEDHIEMSGEKVSCVLRWGVSSDRAFRSEKSLVFPMLRTIPNNTHASMNFRLAADIP